MSSRSAAADDLLRLYERCAQRFRMGAQLATVQPREPRIRGAVSVRDRPIPGKRASHHYRA